MLYEDGLKEIKKILGQIMDMILKYLPSDNTLYYKEQLAKLENQNADMKEELAKITANSLSDGIKHFTFEEMAKQVASHFAEVGDRIAEGDKNYTDLLNYCDTDKMISDYCKEKGIPETNLYQVLKEEKPDISFENSKLSIANELAARGYLNVLDYFQAENYLQDCLDGRIHLDAELSETQKDGVFVLPNYDETLGKNLEKTITHCEEYLGDTILAGGDYFSALEDCKSTIKDELYRIYLDRNIQFEDVLITQDDFFMYGDMQMLYPANSNITFTYDKDTQALDIRYNGLDAELSDLQKDAIQTKAYDMVDMQIEKDEYERKTNQERQEQEEGLDEDDPYSERTLFY